MDIPEKTKVFSELVSIKRTLQALIEQVDIALQKVSPEPGIWLGELNLEVRTFNSLLRQNIETVECLETILDSENGEEKLLSINMFGNHMLEDVKARLAEYRTKNPRENGNHP